MPQSKKYIIITGAASGVGKATCIHLHHLGFKLIFACDYNFIKLEELHCLIPEITVLPVDITNQASVLSLLETVKSVVGENGIYGLINNAGVLPLGPVEVTSIEEINKAFQVNVIGHIRVLKEFLPLLRLGKGRVIFMSSVAGIIPSCTIMGVYSATKHALECFCDVLRVELAPWNIPVIAIESNPIDTPLAIDVKRFSSVMKETLPPESYHLYAEDIVATEKWYNKNLFSKLISPSTVAACMGSALLSDRPKTRYLICDFKTKALLYIRKILPDSLYDKFIRAIRYRRH